MPQCRFCSTEQIFSLHFGSIVIAVRIIVVFSEFDIDCRRVVEFQRVACL